MIPEELARVSERELKEFRPEKLPPGERLPHESMLGLLGFSSSGKTVFVAALHHFINEVNPDASIHATLEGGESSQYLAEIEDILLTRRFITDRGKLKTQLGVAREVKMRISFQNKSILLYVRDVSGDTFNNLLRMDDRDAPLYFLTYGKDEDQITGPFAHLLYCRAYALTVDCEEYETWSRRQYDYVTLVQKLLTAKRVREREICREPLAVIFTKADKLPPDLARQSADDLLARMKDLHDYILEHFHADKIKCVATAIEFEGSQDELRPKVVYTKDGRPRLVLSQKGFSEFLDWLSKFIRDGNPKLSKITKRLT